MCPYAPQPSPNVRTARQPYAQQQTLLPGTDLGTSAASVGAMENTLSPGTARSAKQVAYRWRENAAQPNCGALDTPTIPSMSSHPDLMTDSSPLVAAMHVPAVLRFEDIEDERPTMIIGAFKAPAVEPGALLTRRGPDGMAKAGGSVCDRPPASCADHSGGNVVDHP